MRRRVVITGMGMVNPLGHDLESVWTALQEGRSGVAHTTLFDASAFPTKISAEVKNWDATAASLDPRAGTLLARHACFAANAAQQAVELSGIIDTDLDPTRFGIYLGSGEGEQDFESFSKTILASSSANSFDLVKYTQKALEQGDPIREISQEPNLIASHLAGMFNAQGPNSNCLTACAASSQAMGEATEMIRRDDADVMLSGGAHSMIHPFGVSGFCLLTALSTRNDEPTKASRPFDRDRDGFVLGEGAGMVILEELEHARKRGAPIHGEILGYGSTADAYRITDIHPEGRGAAGCMRMAMKDAGLSPADIDYVNAHGTSTSVNDKVETIACKQAFGEEARKIPVSSTKSMMGHLIAAAGTSEAIVCLMSFRDNVLPPTINQETRDPDCDLDYVPNQARESRCDIALNNSFGFGGQNITLALGRFVA